MGRGFDAMVEMDADGSHQPEDVPRLLAALENADLAIGSRWVTWGRGEELAALEAALVEGRQRVYAAHAQPSRAGRDGWVSCLSHHRP